MSRRCCCLRPGCLIFEDDFNRPNSPSLGSKWLADLGEPNIFSNTLRMPPDSRAICTVPHPVWDATCVINFNMLDIEEGDIFRGIVDFVDDEDDPLYRNYLFGEYEAGPGVSGWLKVGSAVGGVASYKHVVAAGWRAEGDPNVLYVCRTPRGIYAIVGPGAHAWACVGLTGVGSYEPRRWKTGLENPGESTIHVDDFQFWQHAHTDPDCPFCGCECFDGDEFWCMPKTLTLTFRAPGVDQLCSCWDGIQLTLTYDPLSMYSPRWRGQAVIPTWECQGPPLPTIRFALDCITGGQCGSSGRNPGFLLCQEVEGGVAFCGNVEDPPPGGEEQPGTWYTGCDVNGSAGGVGTYACPAVTQCDPLYIKYGTFVCVGGLPLKWCKYDLEITA